MAPLRAPHTPAEGGTMTPSAARTAFPAGARGPRGDRHRWRGRCWGGLCALWVSFLIFPGAMPAAAGQVTAATAEPAQLNTVAAAAQTAPPASAAAQAPPPGMTTYYVALLRRGPKWVATITPEVNQGLGGHQAHVRRLASGGQLLLGGAVLRQV